MVIVAVAMGIIVIAIIKVIARTIPIAISSITVTTTGNAPPQRKTYQNKNPSESQFFIYTITPFLRLYIFGRVPDDFIRKRLPKFLQLAINLLISNGHFNRSCFPALPFNM